MKSLLKKIKGGIAMMVNFFVMQIEQGWITVEDVPKRWREKVRALVELAGIKGEEDDR